MANTDVVVGDAEPGSGRDEWILTGACAGPGGVDYRVEDASERALTDPKPRPILTGTMPCSTDRYPSAVPLDEELVTIAFEVPDGVTVAWAAIVPRWPPVRQQLPGR